MAERRRTFGPVVLVGVLAGVAVAMAGTQPWFAPQGKGNYDCEAPCVGLSYADAGVVSSANALALVTLACWGVVLVTRGRFRHATTFVGLLAAIAATYAVGISWFRTPGDVQNAVEGLGIDSPVIESTGWFWIGAVASLLGVVAWVAALAWVRQWPEMGRRYDTPVTDAPEDLWKALDHGHDPTS